MYPPPPGADLRELCKQLLHSLAADQPLLEAADLDHSAQFGVTKIFLRKHVIQSLEALREVHLQEMDRKATQAQAVFRGFATRRSLEEMWEGFLRLQAAYRAQLYRKQWQMRMEAVRLLQRRVRSWLMMRLFRRMRVAASRVQLWYKKCKLQRQWQYTRRCLRVTHALARGYIVRRHVLLMLSAVRRLQRVARSFLTRNQLYWDKVRAAVLMQAAWRGFNYRIHHEDLIQFLALMRERHAENKAAAKFQAVYLGLLHRRRYAELRNSATMVQHWARGRIGRVSYLRQHRSALQLQAGTRGMQARTRVRKMRTLNMVADEAWRLKTVREREALQLARMNNIQGSANLSDAAAKRRPIVCCQCLDIDMIVDSSDIYSEGWYVK